MRGNGLFAKSANGFTLEGITVLQSGQPYSVEDYSGAVGSQYYSFNDGITNPIIPLAPGYGPKQALTGHSGAFYASNGEAALNPNAFAIPFVNPGQNGVSACGSSFKGAPVCDVFETTFGQDGQRNIFRQSFQKRANVTMAKTFAIYSTLSGRYTFDVFNVTNTPSFDIPNNSIATLQNNPYLPGQNANPNSGQLAFDPTVSTIANRQNIYALQNNGVNVQSASGLGVVQQTIGSSRVVQMSLRLQF